VSSIPYAPTEQLRLTLDASPFPDDTHPGGVFRMLAHTPPLGAAALTLIYAVLSDSELDPSLREIVILRVAQRSQAPYAFSQHSAIATSVGVGAAQVAALAAGALPDELFGPPERAAIAFVDESLDRAHASEQSWRRAMQHFSHRQIVELLLTAGCFRVMSRW
jgi:alkylhydroperoxidase family enzyme